MKLYVMLLVGAIMLMLCMNMVNCEEVEWIGADDGSGSGARGEEGSGSGAGGAEGSGFGPGGEEGSGAGAERGGPAARAKAARTIVKAPKDACKPVKDNCDENKAHHVKCCHEDQGVKCKKIKGPNGKEHMKCVAPAGFKHPKA